VTDTIHEEVTFTQRDVPWMKIGHRVDEAQSLSDALTLAKLDFDVELRKEGYQTTTGTWRIDPSKKKVVRVDTEEPLGTVSSTYEALQYRDAFDFLSVGELDFVAGGNLKFGKQAFMVVQVPGHKTLEVLGEDHHDMYTVVRTSHDGSRALEVLRMALRGTCMNALTLSTFGKGGAYGGNAAQRWSIRHTKNMRSKMEQVQALITGAEAYDTEFAEMAKRLADIDIDVEATEKLITELVKEQHSYVKDQETYVSAIMNTYTSSTRNGYQGNGWGVLNAVSEHYEHVRGGDRRTAEARWTQNFDGLTHKAVDRTARLLLTA
jgi:phage/plasmid-like protein (TIGR03299 family)